MSVPVEPLYRPVGRLLRLAQVADPQQVVETLSMSVAEIGGSDVVLYLIDFDQTRLRPHPDVLPHGEDPIIASVDGSMAGRAFTSGEPLASRREDGWHVWVPVTERAQKLGVLSMTLAAWDEPTEHFCVELGIAAAHLVVTADRYTDLMTLLRRRKDMSLAAEMQWGLLPPLAFSCGSTTIAGLLEPAYEVGGDCFDYSLNGDLLDFAVFDAMGHGLHSAVLSSLTVAAYRSLRRESGSPDLGRLLTDLDSTLAEYGIGEAFVTAVVGRLDIATGVLEWGSAGHPAPLHVRHTGALPTADFRPLLPLGMNATLGRTEVDIVETALEPGDGLLLYTDGVIDARNADGAVFGEARLRDLLERESASEREPTEVLRRLVRSVLGHHDGTPLRDDASTLYLRWDGPLDTWR